MTSRRRRSRRRWSSSRLHRRLIDHRATAVRAALGAALLGGVWLLWPEPDYSWQAQRPGAAGQAVAGVGPGELPVSVGVSAKRQLVGGSAAIRDPVERSLRQVAAAMPDIGMPAVPPAPAPAAEAARAALATAEPERPNASEPAPDEATTPAEPAALRLVPEAGLITRAAAAATAPGPSDRGLDGTAMALLEAPGAVIPPEKVDRRTPTWLRHAVAPAADYQPAIALVVDDLGMNRRATAALSQMPGPLTLAFLPYAAKLDEQTRAARAGGHELMVHVPMEPRGRDWPGPDALTSQLGPTELVSRLREQLRRFDGFVGINNHMGSLLTTDPERMAIVMAELRQRDLLFLDSRTTPESIAAREAGRAGVPYVERDVFIDNELDLDAVLRQLAQAERIARLQGHAVAIGHPHDVTIEALRRWLPTLAARDIALVPVSTIIARQTCASGVVLAADACARYAVAAAASQ